ncbi:MAG TPA: hypothetical protein VKR52_22030 [Terracidiphilus sp.]|nr:hypothetical protein [Terracidiphilus sp.]
MNKGLMRSAIVCIVAATAAASLHAQAGKQITSRDGSCQVTVPGEWEQMANLGIANSPDKSITVAVTSPRLSPQLSQVKENAPKMYPDDKIVKDTPTDFQMEGQNGAHRPNVYRGIQIPGKVCLVEVDYRSGTIDDARKIAATLKGAK